MKVIYIYVLFFVSCFSFVNAQIAEFAPIGAKWWMVEYWPFGPPNAYYIYESEKDTLVGSDLCRKITKHKYFPYTGNEYLEGYELIFQDSSELFIYDFNSGGLRKYFDLGAAVGDTIQTTAYLVEEDSVSYLLSLVTGISDTTLAGETRRKFALTALNPESEYGYTTFAGSFIEGLGSTGYFRPQYQGFATDIQWIGPLRCYEDSILGLIKFVDEDCDYLITGIAEQRQKELSIYPNPANEFLEVSLRDFCDHSMLQIFSYTGEIMYSTQLHGQEIIRIDLKDWQSGYYIATLHTSEGNSVFSSVIVQHE